jgi:hypothetical protein
LTLFFDGEDADAAQLHTHTPLQRTGDLVQDGEDQAFGLGASFKPRPVLLSQISLETLVDATDELRSGEALGRFRQAWKTSMQFHDAQLYPRFSRALTLRSTLTCSVVHNLAAMGFRNRLSKVEPMPCFLWDRFYALAANDV